MVDKLTEEARMNGATPPIMRDLTYAQIIFWAAMISIAGLWLPLLTITC